MSPNDISASPYSQYYHVASHIIQSEHGLRVSRLSLSLRKSFADYLEINIIVQKRNKDRSSGFDKTTVSSNER